MKSFTCDLCPGYYIGNQTDSYALENELGFTIFCEDKETAQDFARKFIGEFKGEGQLKAAAFRDPITVEEVTKSRNLIRAENIKRASAYLGSVEILVYSEKTVNDELKSVTVKAREGDKIRVILVNAEAREEDDKDDFPFIEGSDDRLNTWNVLQRVIAVFP